MLHFHEIEAMRRDGLCLELLEFRQRTHEAGEFQGSAARGWASFFAVPEPGDAKQVLRLQKRRSELTI